MQGELSENVVLVFFISPSILLRVIPYFAEFEAEVFALCDFVKEAAHQVNKSIVFGKNNESITKGTGSFQANKETKWKWYAKQYKKLRYGYEGSKSSSSGHQQCVCPKIQMTEFCSGRGDYWISASHTSSTLINMDFQYYIAYCALHCVSSRWESAEMWSGCMCPLVYQSCSSAVGA